MNPDHRTRQRCVDHGLGTGRECDPAWQREPGPAAALNGDDADTGRLCGFGSQGDEPLCGLFGMAVFFGVRISRATLVGYELGGTEAHAEGDDDGGTGHQPMFVGLHFGLSGLIDGEGGRSGIDSRS